MQRRSHRAIVGHQLYLFRYTRSEFHAYAILLLLHLRIPDPNLSEREILRLGEATSLFLEELRYCLKSLRDLLDAFFLVSISWQLDHVQMF